MGHIMNNWWSTEFATNNLITFTHEKERRVIVYLLNLNICIEEKVCTYTDHYKLTMLQLDTMFYY